MQKIGAELTMSQQCANDISQLLSQRHATAKLVARVLISVGHLENRRERQQFWQRSAAVRKYSEHRRPEVQRAVGLRGAQHCVRAGNPELDSILSSTVKATVVLRPRQQGRKRLRLYTKRVHSLLRFRWKIRAVPVDNLREHR